MGDNYCFIVDNINFKGVLPLEVIPNHWFRKATTEEIHRIKEELIARDAKGIIFLRYESNFIPEAKDKTSSRFGHLPPEKWRYYVISFSGTNDKIRDIEFAANLLKHDINIGFTFISFEGINVSGVIYTPFIMSTLFADPSIHFQKVIFLESKDLLEIKTNYDSITNLDKPRYANIFRAISNFYETKMIPNLSELKALSYFSIIECLLTHVPRPTDTIDSLTHQLSTKMSLLSKRFQRELDYSLRFPQLTESEKVWQKLYSYRSVIAHGGEANFSDSFNVLVSRDNIQEFLKESLKLLLLYALKEPDFITDLQKC